MMGEDPARGENRQRVVLFLPVAFGAAGNQVTVGIESGLDARDDVVQAAGAAGNLTPTIEALAGLARIDGLTQDAGTHKVQVVKVVFYVGLDSE